MAKLRKFVAIVGILVLASLVPVYATAQGTSDGDPVLSWWDAAYEWATGWITVWTAEGEPTDPEGTLPLEPLGPGGAETTTTSGDPDGGETNPGADPDG